MCFEFRQDLGFDTKDSSCYVNVMPQDYTSDNVKNCTLSRFSRSTRHASAGGGGAAAARRKDCFTERDLQHKPRRDRLSGKTIETRERGAAIGETKSVVVSEDMDVVDPEDEKILEGWRKRSYATLGKTDEKLLGDVRGWKRQKKVKTAREFMALPAGVLVPLFQIVPAQFDEFVMEFKRAGEPVDDYEEEKEFNGQLLVHGRKCYDMDFWTVTWWRRLRSGNVAPTMDPKTQGQPNLGPFSAQADVEKLSLL